MEKMSTTEIKLQRQSVQLTKGENQVSNSENMAPLSQYLQPLCLYQMNCLVRQRRKDSDRAFCSQIRLNSNSHEPYCESKSPYSSKSERTMAEQKEDDPSELIYRPNTRRRHQKSQAILTGLLIVQLTIEMSSLFSTKRRKNRFAMHSVDWTGISLLNQRFSLKTQPI